MMEDDEPWADPQIKLNYEKALGSFLVRFNRIENAISSIIYQALHCLSSDDLAQFVALNRGALASSVG
ncbi:hypothetical protein [Pelagibacterium sp.]|uniref:hypothetical protein n=1 Tax=Pelagibacterium sp. TaxID=1967288 RepID=UPI003BAB6620